MKITIEDEGVPSPTMEIAKIDNDEYDENDKEKDTISQDQLVRQHKFSRKKLNSINSPKKCRKRRGRVQRHAEIIKLKTMHDVLEKSPRQVMPLLQTSKRESPSGESWKVHTNELAIIDEIRKEIKAAFDSGKIKGKRLFNEGGEILSEEDMCSVCLSSLVQDCVESLVTSEGVNIPDGENDNIVSCQDWRSNISYLSDDEKEDLVKEVSHGIEYKRTCRFSKVWVVTALIVVALLIIMSTFDGHGNAGNRVIIVPT